MADYFWGAAGGGNFNDSDNWKKGGSDEHGVPGGGDTADMAGHVVSVNAAGASVAVLKGHGSTFTGGVNASSEMDNVRLAGGSSSTGKFYLSELVSGSLSAAIADLATISGGTLDAGELGDGSISGNAVVTANFAGETLDTNLGISGTAAVTLGSMDLHKGTGVGITLNGGTLDVAKSGGTAQIGADAGGGFLRINGGTATVGALATVQWGFVTVAGGTLDLKKGLSLVSIGSTFKQGDLNVAAGGTVKVAGATLVDEAQTASNQGLSVAGGVLRLDGKVTIGGTRNGVLNLSDLGLAEINAGTAGVVLGAAKGSRGSIALGSEATLNITGPFTLGQSGGGSATVGGGAKFTLNGEATLGDKGNGGFSVFGPKSAAAFKDSVVLANAAGSVASLTAGSEAKATVSDDILAGREGTGRVQATAGGDLSAGGDVILGAFKGSNGAALVTGAGSTLKVVRDVYVASDGTGDLSVLQGGSFSAGRLFVGAGPEGTGTATVSGAKSVANLKKGAIIGTEGFGKLTVEAGGKFVSGLVEAGLEAKVKGEIVVDKATLTASAARIGEEGVGAVTVRNGAKASFSEKSDDFASVSLGHAKGGTGTLSVVGKGTSLTAAGSLEVGESGKGVLTVGTKAVLRADTIHVAWLEAGGNGAFTVRSGAQVSAGSMLVGNEDAQTTATAMVEGKGSFLSLSAKGKGLIVSGKAGAALTVKDGGAVTFDADTVFGIGARKGSSGTVTVSGEGSLLEALNQFVRVGKGGTGSLAVTKGGDVDLRKAELGLDGGKGTLTVDGKGSTASVSHSLVLGDTSAGTSGLLAVRNGGDVKAGRIDMLTHATLDVSDKGSVEIGKAKAAGGTVTIGSAGALKGAGTVRGTIDNDGTVEAKGGVLTLREGTLKGDGRLQIDEKASFDFSKAKADGSLGTLDLEGKLALGSHDLVVKEEYRNSHWGSGNSFDPHAGVSGKGDIIGEGARLTVTGDVAKKSGGYVLQFEKGEKGLQEATFRIKNAGDEVAITAALQTRQLADSGIKGAKAGNVSLEAGESSGTYKLTYDPAKGSLSGKYLTILSNFDNVAPVKISFAAAKAASKALVSDDAALDSFAFVSFTPETHGGEDGDAASASLHVMTASGGQPVQPLAETDISPADFAHHHLPADLLLV